MKYVKIDPFEKHLDEALPDHPSDVYFILMDDPFERAFVAKRLCNKLRIDVIHSENDNLLEELESPSLFSKKRILICDDVKEKEIPKVDDLILIFTGKTAPPFYKKMEKEGTTLDLSGEKPWDRKSRLQRWLLECARERGKALSVDGATYLIDFSHADFSTLLQELDKIVAYSGEKKSITLEIVKGICSLDPVQSGWELSEAVVLGGFVHFDEVDLYSLIGQLRYQLQLGLQIAMAKEPPKASPKKIERFRRSGLKISYFMDGLKDLFDLEMKMRSNISNQGLLFDQFRAKLAARR
ncbi:MAG: hypothetical protein KFB93_05520 [Simkaniaceae bacterium]|jgi:hypothetical protein|nr:MAG: hypothetical protein KFB93_05520 [Simkaniaceae bacterium]